MYFVSSFLCPREANQKLIDYFTYVKDACPVASGEEDGSRPKLTGAKLLVFRLWFALAETSALNWAGQARGPITQPKNINFISNRFWV